MAACISVAKMDFFTPLNLADGSLIYKTGRLGSMEGSFSVDDGRAYIGTEQGDLFCLNLADGSTVWKARIGADSDSTPAVSEGFVYTAAENGVVYCFRQVEWRTCLEVPGARRHGQRT